MPFDATSSLTPIGGEALPVSSRDGFLSFHGSLPGQVPPSYVATLESPEGGLLVSGVRGTAFDSASLPEAELVPAGTLDYRPASTLLLPAFLRGRIPAIRTARIRCSGSPTPRPRPRWPT